MLRLITILALLALPVAAAAHDEAKTPPTGSMILDITKTPDPSRDRAFNESLRLDGPPPARPPLQGIVQPDGSVKYGNTTVIIHRDCPPGGEFFQPPALPGRRR
jgi:hypothetical protein